MIRLENISKQYGQGNAATLALSQVSFTAEAGDFVAVMGASGSGKSTLLSIIGLMDTPSSGSYYLCGRRVSELGPGELSKLRSERLTFVFQNFALMEKYSAFENIELPLLSQRVSFKERRRRVREAAWRLGIEDQLKKLPKEMSGGQQQRVGLARALASGAQIILADEPTGCLDKRNGLEVMELFKELNEDGKTILMVTHDAAVAAYAKRIVTISDGRIRE